MCGSEAELKREVGILRDIYMRIVSLLMTLVIGSTGIPSKEGIKRRANS